VPTQAAVSKINLEIVSKNIKKYLDVTKDFVVEIVMKENHTLEESLII
jgi:hypothetical protein